MFSPLLLPMIIEQERSLGHSSQCNSCGRTFLAHSDGCPHCGSLRTSSMEPPLNLSDCRKGSYAISWSRKEGVRIVSNE